MIEKDFHIVTIDASNPHWCTDERYMHFWLKNLERYLNDIIESSGMLCVNDVRTKLGVSPIKMGYLYGWDKPVDDIFDVLRTEDRLIVGLLGCHDFRKDVE